MGGIDRALPEVGMVERFPDSSNAGQSRRLPERILEPAGNPKPVALASASTGDQLLSRWSCLTRPVAFAVVVPRDQTLSHWSQPWLATRAWARSGRWRKPKCPPQPGGGHRHRLQGRVETLPTGSFMG